MDVMNYLNESTSDSNGVEPNSNKLPSSRYKGVVPQPNGRWGAQIYEKHQRVWLGTFNEEEEAAKAYDIASLRFRGLDAITNFKQQPLKTTNIDDHDDDNNETLFLQSHSKAEIVDMLRKHSYTDELELYKHSNAARYEARKRIKCDNLSSTYKAKREWLFEKVATPSDVGRLNRMVIPKQQAEKHFPLMGNSEDDDHSAASSKGILLNFVDQVGKVWRFRYCYWSSSQSYVLTKGWSRFVKEKKLKAGDVVRFQRSIGENGKLFIDCTPRNVDVSRFADVPGSRVDDDDPLVPGQVDGVVRLFGVNIVETCSSCVVDNRRCWRLGAKMR